MRVQIRRAIVVMGASLLTLPMVARAQTEVVYLSGALIPFVESVLGEDSHEGRRHRFSEEMLDPDVDARLLGVLGVGLFVLDALGENAGETTRTEGEIRTCLLAAMSLDRELQAAAKAAAVAHLACPAIRLSLEDGGPKPEVDQASGEPPEVGVTDAGAWTGELEDDERLGRVLEYKRRRVLRRFFTETSIDSYSTGSTSVVDGMAYASGQQTSNIDTEELWRIEDGRRMELETREFAVRVRDPSMTLRLDTEYAESLQRRKNERIAGGVMLLAGIPMIVGGVVGLSNTRGEGYAVPISVGITLTSLGPSFLGFAQKQLSSTEVTVQPPEKPDHLDHLGLGALDHFRMEFDRRIRV